MNHIRFMMSKIKEYSLLYETVKDAIEDPLGEESIYSEEIDHIQDYCKQIVGEVVAKIPEVLQSKYEGARERIANEVYLLSAHRARYRVALTVDTYEQNDTQICVDIEPDYDSEQETGNDRILETLKLELKNRLVEDWEKCIWLIDEQSEFLCSELYPKFFSTENKIRAFVNRVMNQRVGTEWLNSFGLEKYYESAIEMEKIFRQRVPEYENVDAKLMSLTLEALFEILFKGIIFKNDTVLQPEDFNIISTMTKNGKKENIKDFLLGKRKPDIA